MKNNKKQKLLDLGPECLANTILELADKYELIRDVVDRLTATPAENIQRLKKKIANLKSKTRAIDGNESELVALKLGLLLQDIKTCVTDPVIGVELVSSFYETDSYILGRSDDSWHHIREVYNSEAYELFTEYAERCEDQNKVGDIILKLVMNDEYTVRDGLLDCAGEFLPESVLRSMIATLQKLIKKYIDDDGFGLSRYHMLLRPLAAQVKDAKLCEETFLAFGGELSPSTLVDMARMYLESGDVETACLRLNQIPQSDRGRAFGREELLLEIYKFQGDNEKLADLLFQKFRKERSLETLKDILEVIGHDKRDEVIATEVALILKGSAFSEADVEFLILLQKFEEADLYLFKRAKKLKRFYNDAMLPLAKVMESKGRNLSSSLIYRGLLLSIFDHEAPGAYARGVLYLKKLDKMAGNITDWKKVDSHEVFKEQIVKAHGSKQKFWSKYEVKK